MRGEERIRLDALQWSPERNEYLLLLVIVKLPRDLPIWINVQIPKRGHEGPLPLEELRHRVALDVRARIIRRLLRHPKLDLEEELIIAIVQVRFVRGPKFGNLPLVHHVDHPSTIESIACYTCWIPRDDSVRLPMFYPLQHPIEHRPPDLVRRLRFLKDLHHIKPLALHQRDEFPFLCIKAEDLPILLLGALTAVEKVTHDS
ncbi:MAG: hypothetical protein WC654_06015 [Patescibacteria group bacterium]